MMSKKLFVREYEMKASVKMLFPYISSASGLQQWFATKVNNMADHKMDFIWDKESHVAKIHSMRTNKSIRFDFVGTGDADEKDLNYVEFKLEQSEFTQSTYFKVTDYSANQDEGDLITLWDDLLDNLKGIVGG